MFDDKFIPIIGLEIHVELKTKSKMFCGCDADYFGHKPNTHCCPVCLGLPGALPVPNRKAVEWCVMLGLALNCEIPEFSKFDRKNYFYPDLPKGYQISQYDKPFAISGSLKFKIQNSKCKIEEEKIIRIRRVHMEEDTGKLLHATVNGEKCTLIDFNRSGVPLVEVVTEPDIRSSEDARTFLKKLYQIIRYLGISDADMEKGSMRLEPNISVKVKSPCLAGRQENSKVKSESGQDTSDGGPEQSRRDSSEVEEAELPRYKVEVKNINSFNFVKKAIDYEVIRQIEILKRGEIPEQETRGWDEKKGITYSQRSKEEAHDYRYFPEPDIPPVRWTESQISKIKSQIPELPDQKIESFIKEYCLSEYDAVILTETKELADYYENCVKYQASNMKYKDITPKIIANWIINRKANTVKVSPEELIKLISQKQQVVQVDEKELERIIEIIIINNQKAVTDYKSGKQAALMFLVGLVMRELKGQADAVNIKNLLEKRLQS